MAGIRHCRSSFDRIRPLALGRGHYFKNEERILLPFGQCWACRIQRRLSFFGQAIIFRYRLLKARGREDFARKSAPQRNRNRNRKRPSGGGGNQSQGEGGNRSGGFKSRFEE